MLNTIHDLNIDNEKVRNFIQGIYLFRSSTSSANEWVKARNLLQEAQEQINNIALNNFKQLQNDIEQ